MAGRFYKIRVYDGNFEVLTKRNIVTAFDVDATGPQAFAQETTLNALLWNLAEIARKTEGSDKEDVRLELWDEQNDHKVFDWMGR